MKRGRMRDPSLDARRTVAEQSLRPVQVLEGHKPRVASIRRNVKNNFGNARKRRTHRTQARVKHVGHAVNSKLLPKHNARDFGVHLNPAKLTGINANGWRPGCNFHRNVFFLRKDFFRDDGAAVSVTTPNRSASDTGKESFLRKIALMRSRRQHQSAARRRVEQFDLLLKRFGEGRIGVFAIHLKIRKGHCRRSSIGLPTYGLQLFPSWPQQGPKVSSKRNRRFLGRCGRGCSQHRRRFVSSSQHRRKPLTR